MWTRIEDNISNDADVMEAGWWGECVFVAAIQYSSALNLHGFLPAKVTGKVLAAFKRCPHVEEFEGGLDAAIVAGLLTRQANGNLMIEPLRWRKATRKSDAERSAEWRDRQKDADIRGSQESVTDTSDTRMDNGHGHGTDTERSGSTPNGVDLPVPPDAPAAPAPRLLSSKSERNKADSPNARIKLNFDTAEWVGITDADRSRWRRACPLSLPDDAALDAALARAANWCVDNRADAPRTAFAGWITKWLNTDERGATRRSNSVPSPVRALPQTSHPSDAAWMEVCDALADYTGAPGDNEAFERLVSPDASAAVRGIGGLSTVWRALNGTVSDRTQIQRQFERAWRKTDA